jgi:hypothetical protein
VFFIGNPNVIMDGRDIYWELLTTVGARQRQWKHFNDWLGSWFEQ